jgi:thiol-disulfide isomerase/thioredoxin
MKKMKALLFTGTLLLTSTLLAQPNNDSTSPYSNPPHSPSFNSSSLGSINWVKSYSDAVALSQSTSKPIVILFTGSSWCPACMKLEREVISNPEFAKAVGQKFVFLKAEFPNYSEGSMMSSPYKALLDRYGVDAFPTMVVVNANGQQLFRVNYRNGGVRAYAQELLQKLNQR